MKRTKLFASVVLIALIALCSCSGKENKNKPVIISTPVSITTAASAPDDGEPEDTEDVSVTDDTSEEESEEPAKKSNDIVILVTSDTHCSPQKNFGYAGLYRIREKFQKEGCEVLLVDDGDQIEGHGEMFGTVTQGEQVIDLMNKMGYDCAIPGNHEFVYGADYYVQLTKKANFPILSCNIFRKGKLVFKPYIIKEVRGKKIAFVGATTPRAMGYYTSVGMFMNANAKVIYEFMDGGKGKTLNNVIQKNVDKARAAGADYVFLISHIGQAKKYKDYENITYVIQNTRGIDAVLDGHSHDVRRFEVINAEGIPVPRIGIGSKFSRIGYVRISEETGKLDVGLYSWTSTSTSATELFGIKNEMSEEVDKALKKYDKTFNGKRGTVTAPLLITDPVKTDAEGNPVKIVNKSETNMGDFVADAFRFTTGADVALVASDKISGSLQAGKVSMHDMFSVTPNAKKIIVVEATGQQILDALEWAYRRYPKGNAGFLQVSGISLKIDTSEKNHCKSKNGKFVKVEGKKRRVKNVKIGGLPVDPKRKYKVASYISLLWRSSDGFTMFKECKRVKTENRLDFQLLTDYLQVNLNGTTGNRYNDPSGQARISRSK